MKGRREAGWERGRVLKREAGCDSNAFCCLENWAKIKIYKGLRGFSFEIPLNQQFYNFFVSFHTFIHT